MCWTISGDDGGTYVYHINGDGHFNGEIDYSNLRITFEFSPVIYISSNIRLEGQGSASNPYHLSQ